MIGQLDKPQTLGGKIRFPALGSFLKGRRLWATLGALLLVFALIAGSLVLVRGKAQADYLTQPVARQDLTQTVTASGTVNPQDTVNVGTQISGTISEIDVDYNSKVKKGQVLARIDPSQLQAQLAQAQANLAQAQAQADAAAANAGGAQAGVTAAQASGAAQAANAQAAQAGIATAEAGVTKAQSAAAVAEQTVSRDRALLSQGYIPQSQYDNDQANAVAADSAVKSAQAAVAQARAQASASVSQAQAGAAQASQTAAQAAGSGDTAQAAQAAVAAAQAMVQQDQLNLGRTVITSPVDGTVIARSVSVGQTVAASLQTPTLFTIAQDLKKMQVDIAVGEPDIGNLKNGDAVDFSVLAYPDETFHGVVSQVRENPTTVNNVVTYDVLTLVQNTQNKLLPGMTANASIHVKTIRNALVVPASALSFRPTGGHAPKHRTSYAKPATGAASGSKKSASPWGQMSGTAGSSASAGGTGMIFVLNGKQLRPVRVHVDMISGAQAAVTPLRGTLQPGDNVAIGSAQAGGTAPRSGSSRSGMGGIGRALR